MKMTLFDEIAPQRSLDRTTVTMTFNIHMPSSLSYPLLEHFDTTDVSELKFGNTLYNTIDAVQERVHTTNSTTLYSTSSTLSTGDTAARDADNVIGSSRTDHSVLGIGSLLFQKTLRTTLLVFIHSMLL